ncbi:MAG: ABC transporter permease [Gemmatimonadaceae bacterium]
MPFIEAVRLALATIRVQKLKSFFTLLGVTIGVMFLIAVVSIVEGMGNYVEHEFVAKLMGINTFELRQRPNFVTGNVTREEWLAWQRRPRIRVSDVEPVVSELSAGTRWAHESDAEVSVESRYAGVRMLQTSAVDGDYFTIKRLDLEQGRVFSPQEFQMGSSVVVVGPEVARRYFPSLNPVGQELRLNGQPYTVIGVTESQGAIFGQSLDQFLIAPYRSPVRRAVNPPGIVDAVVIQSPTTEQMDEAMETVRGLMRGRHTLRPSQEDDFSLQTSESALSFWKKIKANLVAAGVALPAFGLVVGAIVIMNIMLVAVAERTHEIGIRKALGARRRDIMAQFLVEAATLSTVGAVLGILLGITLSQLIAAFTPLPAAVAPWSIVAATLLGAGVGIASGLYPASRASRLDPIAALRQE